MRAESTRPLMPAALGRLALALVLLTVPGARAAESRFQAEHFEPTFAQGLNTLNIYTSSILGHLEPSAGLFFHYVAEPLVLVERDDEGNVTDRLVRGQLKAELNAGIGLFDWVDIGLVLPLVLTQSGDDLAAMGSAGSSVAGVAIADLRVTPRVRVLKPEDFWGFGLAVALPLYVPVGDQESFNSDGAFRAQPEVVLDWTHDWGINVALNLGAQFRPKREGLNYVSEDVFRWGLGVRTATGVEDLFALVSVFGTVQTVDDRDPLTREPTDDGKGSPAEGLLGVEYRFPYELVADLGFGRGLNRAVGSPSWRVFFSASYTPIASDRDGDGIGDRDDTCPDDPEDRDGFEDTDGCPDPDNDGDGVPDTRDGCPNDPEDADGFEDSDGCPDPDNDKDGIADTRDSCPNDPEDADGFEDSDGCPDPDNDQDGVPDATDKCPLEPEDRDFFEDADGCPDPDNDQDGIADERDQCPDHPETVNGVNDEDGCPDANEYKKIRVTRKKIEILDKVYFATNKAVIRKRSFRLLDNVAKVINDNPQITKIRIEGHTDNEGTDEHNMKLSDARAASVRKYLEDKGVDPARLVAQGYGETRPIADNETRAGRAENRRVEFVILEMHGEAVEQDSGE